MLYNAVVRKILKGSVFFTIAVFGSFFVLPLSAGGTPTITLVSPTTLTVPPVIENNVFIARLDVVGTNLNYVIDNQDQKNPSVIQLGPFKPKSIYHIENDDSNLAVTFRIPLDEVDVNDPYYKVRIYATDGSVLATSEQEVFIYNSKTIVPVIDSLSQTFVSLTSKTPFQKTITLNGTGLEWLVNNGSTKGVASLGKAKSVAVEGDSDSADVTFLLNSNNFRKNKRYYRIRIYRDNQVIATSPRIQVFNPYRLKKKSRDTLEYLNNTDNTTASKRTVGLNVQLGLGADTEEKIALYKEKLKESNTVWVREHISYENIMGPNSRLWLEKYDEVMTYYNNKNMRVVAMLAYGADGSENTAPPIDDWEIFVRKVATRYRNYVDAWEIWNEPDLAEFLTPNNADTLAPLLKTAYPIIKAQAPDSIVLNGPIGNIRTTTFVQDLYEKAGDYFDELSVHAYYCDEYMNSGDMNELIDDLTAIAAARPTKYRDGKIWLTEVGCSMGTSGVDETVQLNYNKNSTTALLATGRVRLVQLYTIINRPEQDNYEKNFGMLYEDGTEKSAWQWYENL
ncbi:MAG TPA: hypothetical protein DEG44_03290 [Candidatus Kerfeldbacteria bacterium]|nr:hypothetical protein [Candidatus Kerfeldbacteria bacterium]